MSLQVSGNSFHFSSKPKHVCISTRRVQLVHNDNTIQSTPTTTSIKKKSVRFCSDDELEQVRLFIKTQTPLSVHSDPAPYRFNIQYPNWPSKWSMYKSLASGVMIRMENIQLEDNHKLIGRCRVANIAFEKQVTVRYSLNHWKTFKEINATFREPIPPRLSWDRFTFDIDIPHHEQSATCWIALCYHVNQQEYWDNNDGQNYQIELISIQSPLLTPPLQLSDTDEEDDEEITEYPLDQLKSRYSFANAPPPLLNKHVSTSSLTLPSSHQLGYQDFISKYCFYNSSIVQN